MEQTIAAIATPLALGGISVIRVSGKDAIKTAQTVFVAQNGRKLSQMKGYTCCLGQIFDGSEPIDEAIATVFRAPKSYTGEDVVEFSCHGGVYSTRRVLRTLLDAGALLAGPGEFTKRAFLNGKLGLTQAEAVMDLIGSQGEQALRCAKNNADGALEKMLAEITQQLLSIAAHLSAWVDYPEDDIEQLEQQTVTAVIDQAHVALTSLLDNFETGKLFREGITTAIVGKPNVGKSTLMNLLAGWDKSIVTEIAGTTRDVVEETVHLGNVLLRLADTAGIRQTDDVVEQIGVDKAKRRLAGAQLVLAVFDQSAPLDDADRSLIDALDPAHTIVILNKSDLGQRIDTTPFEKTFHHVVTVCAKQDHTKQTLTQAVEALLVNKPLDAAQPMLANERQRACARAAQQALEQAKQAICAGFTLDAVTVEIEQSIEALLQLTGQRVTNAVVDEVFSQFCVGK